MLVILLLRCFLGLALAMAGAQANMYDKVVIKFTDKEQEAKVNATPLQRLVMGQFRDQISSLGGLWLALLALFLNSLKAFDPKDM